MSWTVHCADVLTWCEDYAAKIERGEAEKFHCILTDPPYGLSDTPDMAEVLTHWLAGDDYEHKGGGMMGKSWDSFIPGPSVWATLRRMCYAGAYLFAFGGTRTADLLSVALRLAGWERFDEIDVLGGSVSWIQGSGFPKSTAIGKAIDRAANAEREVVGRSPYASRRPNPMDGTTYVMNESKWDISKGLDETAPATPLAAAWSQHGTATKPAHEPVLCFRAPLAKVPSDRIHAVTSWDWWHSEKALKDTPQTRLKMLKKYGCRLPPLYGDSDLVLITRKALHERVETDKLFVARARRQWRAAPTEPVTLARVDVKAYRRWSSKTYAANCLSTGAGGLWIDGARVGFGLDGDGEWHSTPGKGTAGIDKGTTGIYGYYGGNAEIKDNIRYTTKGRWPPNCALVHIPPRPDGNGGWLPGCERLGVKRVRGGKAIDSVNETGAGWFEEDGRGYRQGYADPDGLEPVTAYACVLACDACGHQWTAEQRGACPECGGEARWACAVGELGEQSGERAASYRKNGSYGAPEQALFKGVGNRGEIPYKDEGTAARFYPQFTWQHEIAERLAGVTPFYYCAKSARRERDQGLDETFPLGEPRRNHHPCCKPISLISDFLAKLLLPPPEYAPRRILIPFGGSGSEAIGAALTGWDEIVMIEMGEEYCDIARARLRFWTDWAARGYDDSAAILKAAKREETRREEAQMELL